MLKMLFLYLMYIVGMEYEVLDSMELFCKNRRFDLIYKVKLAQAMKMSKKFWQFYCDQYLISIKHFNDFYESFPSKNTSKDFLHHFHALFESIVKNGFNTSHPVEMSPSFELASGSHRLAVCVVLGKEIFVKMVENKHWRWDYCFFLRKKLPVACADWGVLEYVKLNKNAFVVSVFPVLPRKLDQKVEGVLKEYGFIYYKKSLQLTYGGCVNLKHINCGNEKWIGNDFIRTMQVYIFVCENRSSLILAKKEIRTLLDVGEFSIHINDFREEAVELVQTYFNENSWFVLNHRMANNWTEKLDGLVTEFKKYLWLNNYSADDFCVCGSTPIGVLGLRYVHDFNFIHLDNKIVEPKNSRLSDRVEELGYYSQSKEVIIVNPKYHFYYHGVKFISLEMLQEMETKRLKDVNDLITLSRFFVKKREKKKQIMKKIQGKRKMKVSKSRTKIL